MVGLLFSRKGFFLRGRGRSFHIEGMKIEKTCPQEFQPVRSFLQRGLLVSNVSCEEEFVVNFTCEPLPSTASPSGPNSSLIAPAKESDLTTQGPPHSTTARNVQQNQEQSGSISLAFVAFGCSLALVFLVVLGAVYMKKIWQGLHGCWNRLHGYERTVDLDNTV